MAFRVQRAWHESPLPCWFADPDFQTAFEPLLNATRHGAADAVEILEAAGRVRDGDATSWVDEWAATAGTVWALAHAAAGQRHQVSAREHFLRAATYYGIAGALAHRSDEPDRAAPLRARQRACWEQAIRDVAQPLDVAGHFFRAPGALPGERRALVIVDPGAGPASDAWSRAGAGAGRRGHHWMTLEPRPDGDAALSATVEAMRDRSDVDPDRITLIGVDDGAADLPHALAREHRLVAAVADPASPVALATLDAIRTPLLLCGPHARLVSPDLPSIDEPVSPGVREAHVFDWLATYLD